MIFKPKKKDRTLLKVIVGIIVIGGVALAVTQAPQWTVDLYLAALLLFFSEAKPTGDTIVLLRQILRAVRRALGLGTPWKRNTFSPRRSKTKSITQQGENH